MPSVEHRRHKGLGCRHHTNQVDGAREGAAGQTLPSSWQVQEHTPTREGDAVVAPGFSVDTCRCHFVLALISRQRPRVSSLNRAFTADVDAADVRWGSFDVLASEPGPSSLDKVLVGADLI